MGSVRDDLISTFYEHFAAALEDDQIWAEISKINAADVERAQARGRSTTRLVTNEKMRRGMIEGLRGWINAPSRRGQILETVEHDGFTVELVGTGARWLVLPLSLRAAQRVGGCVWCVARRQHGCLPHWQRCLADRASDHAAGAQSGPFCGGIARWGGRAGGKCGPCCRAGPSFPAPRLGLAGNIGSGPAVDTLGSLARSVGVNVSLHSTGGAWIVASASAVPVNSSASSNAHSTARSATH
ncbi:MAG: hypothetical protein R2867_30010 [Caldilineaceae bacterium]